MNTINKSVLRNVFVYLVAFLSQNSIDRKSMTSEEISAGMGGESRQILPAVLKAMLKKEWAKMDGPNRHPIYVSTALMNKSKLPDDESVTRAVDEIWPMLKNTRIDSRDLNDAQSGPVYSAEAVKESGIAEGDGELPDLATAMKAIHEMARCSPEVLVQALRDEGWEVTARKTTVVEL